MEAISGLPETFPVPTMLLEVDNGLAASPVDHAVCAVESVDGAPAVIELCRRGTPVERKNQGKALVLKRMRAEKSALRRRDVVYSGLRETCSEFP